MTFMKPQHYPDQAYEVLTEYGSWIVPFEIAGNNANNNTLLQYVKGKIIHTVKVLPMGWIYRLCAPGYLDCTEWNYAYTETDALAGLADLMGEDYIEIGE